MIQPGLWVSFQQTEETGGNTEALRGEFTLYSRAV